MAPDDLHEANPPADGPPPLPALAADARDPAALRKSIEDSAAVSGGLWLSYLFVLFYLGIAASAVTHVDLFVQNPVKLPFLNIELPLLAFFFLAPLLFLIVHAYTLVNLALLADRIRQFHRELGDRLEDPALRATAAEIRAAQTRQLPSNLFVQFLGGPDDIREGALGRLLAAILWVSLVVAPIALLLLLQIKFLPYHSWWITWTSRIVLILDLGLLWWLWRNILESRLHRATRRRWRSWVKTSIAAFLSVSIVLFACAAATIPGEWPERPGTGRTDSLVANTLMLSEFNLYEALKIDDPKKVEWKEHLIDLRDRDLRQAILFGAILPKPDLRGFAELQGATLRYAQLQSASLDWAQLQGASLDLAQLQRASLKGAQLQGASLDLAQLQGASLEGAQLQGASLKGAQLEGASLKGAQLEGASLDGAFLWRAQLDGVDAKDLFAPVGSPDWSPEQMAYGEKEPWTDASYTALSQSIAEKVPRGEIRAEALKRIAILHCARKGDTIATCSPSAEPPAAVKQWQERIQAASIDRAVYAKALAKILGDLVCSGEPDRIYVLRGLWPSDRFRGTGSEMPALAKRITSPECPVSTALTDADKRALAEATRNAVSSAKPR